MTLLVSSYKASFAPGRFLVQSGDSLNASSALQLLDTRVPDHDPGFVVEFVVLALELFCPATAKGAMEKTAARKRRKRFAVESTLTDSVNLGPFYFLASIRTVPRPVSAHKFFEIELYDSYKLLASCVAMFGRLWSLFSQYAAQHRDEDRVNNGTNKGARSNQAAMACQVVVHKRRIVSHQPV